MIIGARNEDAVLVAFSKLPFVKKRLSLVDYSSLADSHD
jgi:hypothetical protein